MRATRELLLAERGSARSRVADLEREFTGIAEAASEPGTDDEHDPEGATLAFERQHTAALLARARDRVAEIDAALARLDDGTYGRCARCGQPIGEDRLAARPAATTCVRCARLSGNPLTASRSAASRPGRTPSPPGPGRAWRRVRPGAGRVRPFAGRCRRSAGRCRRSAGRCRRSAGRWCRSGGPRPQIAGQWRRNARRRWPSTA
ncbi:MAG: TraR/DksA C4-type zinc finger protein [Nocardiopsaceae bacterium]|nr:TraR/DksA C4-type zinc finger protein [Nocardiopsaceae bacterium]